MTRAQEIASKIQAPSHWIHGERLLSSSAHSFENKSPAEGFILSRVNSADATIIGQAVDSSLRAQKTWAALTGTQRGRILHETSRLLRERLPELAQIECLDVGKPISEALQVDVTSAADCLEYFAGQAASLHGEQISLENSFAYTRREPLGVCVGIGAWNYPLQIACWKAAPALAAGNSMIFKPSELSPTSVNILAEIFQEAGLPAGVFNIVQGEKETGRLLCEHPSVAKISLTGSVPTGRSVAIQAAQRLKQVTLELGGKSPLIVFEDSNLEQAVSAAMLANFYTQGEICSNGTRVFIQESIKEDFLKLLVSRVEKLQVGDPLDPTTQVGAIISSTQLQKIQNYIRLAQEQGARNLCGGNTPQWNSDKDYLKNGNFIRPCVLTECEDSMTHVKEEIFGPVLSALSFRSEEEVLERANQTPFGLAAGVFTENLKRGHRVAAQLDAGICWINHYNITPIEIPFGGFKDSGLGKENGRIALDHYTRLKTVLVNLGEVETPYL